MSNIELNTNDVNDTGALSEGVTSDRCPVEQQRRPGCIPLESLSRARFSRSLLAKIRVGFPDFSIFTSKEINHSQISAS